MLVSACSSKHVVVGTQCPSPYSSKGTFAREDAGGSIVFGTSCAPCQRLKLDKRGCPIYVTFASCGGDICLGDQRIARPKGAGSGGEDAGTDEDAGQLASEDGGAR